MEVRVSFTQAGLGGRTMSFLAIGEEECPCQRSQRVEDKHEACHGAFRKESRDAGRAGQRMAGMQVTGQARAGFM